MGRPLWSKSGYREYKHLIVSGRIGAHGGPPNPALGECDTQWIAPGMPQAVCTGSKGPKRATDEAYEQMVAIYKKWKQADA